MDIVYADAAVLVCVKPAGVLSTDEPGGLPSLVREALGDRAADVRTVHRLDRAVSGLIVLARGREAASRLSEEIRAGGFEKEYLAMVHGSTPDGGELRDLLWRDKARKMTFVADTPAKGVQEAVLDFETLRRGEGMSLVRVHLHTGRTHQIRVQFASRGFPLFGERKYCENPDDCPLALWSRAVGFTHPVTEERLRFVLEPPEVFPWDVCQETDIPCNRTPRRL
ncbi:MAG: RluA family pseudouridine synthase [Oscillospiraceae bacterium]|nr:RluA family pseudouridine synthase [Oscillospiraceae bacterium]